MLCVENRRYCPYIDWAASVPPRGGTGVHNEPRLRSGVWRNAPTLLPSKPRKTGPFRPAKRRFAPAFAARQPLRNSVRPKNYTTISRPLLTSFMHRVLNFAPCHVIFCILALCCRMAAKSAQKAHLSRQKGPPRVEAAPSTGPSSFPVIFGSRTRSIRSRRQTARAPRRRRKRSSSRPHTRRRC